MTRFLTILFLFCIASVSYSQEAVKIVVFDNPQLAKTVAPDKEICFQYKITYKGSFSGNKQEGCFLINDEVGAALSFGFDNKYQSGCNYNILDENFTAFLFTLKGNTYTYYNRKERAGKTGGFQVQHYVMTGNTEPESPENMFNRKKFLAKDDYRTFCNGEFKGRKYVDNEGEMSVYIEYNDSMPEIIEGLNFLGAYGIGFIHTQAGSFRLLGYSYGKTETETVSFKKMPFSECFKPQSFIKVEDKSVRVAISSVHERNVHLSKTIEKAKTVSNDCAAMKVKWLEEEKRQNKLKEQQLNWIKDNRAAKTNPGNLRKLTENIDPFAPYLVLRLEVEYNLCVLEKNINRGEYKKEEYTKVLKRKECYTKQIEEMKKMEEEAKSIKIKYAKDKDKQAEEEAKLLMRSFQILKKKNCE